MSAVSADTAVASIDEALGKMGLTYQYHVCAEEIGNGDTVDGPTWKEPKSGAQTPIEPGTRRFLVRLSKPTQTEPIPKQVVDIHLTVPSAVGSEGDMAQMRYTVEHEAMVRTVVDGDGKLKINADEWIFDRMIATKIAFAAQ